MKERLLKRLAAGCRMAILMSGEGSNGRAVLEQKARYPHLEFVGIVTNKEGSGAPRLGERFGLPVFVGRSFEKIAEQLREWEVEALLYAGFMRISPGWFLQEFPGLNIHPADLSIQEGGKPKYVGLDVVRKAMEAKESYLASTVHVVEEGVDEGAILAISEPLERSEWENLTPDEAHQLLKEEREHALYPDCLSILSRTRSILASSASSM